MTSKGVEFARLVTNSSLSQLKQLCSDHSIPLPVSTTRESLVSLLVSHNIPIPNRKRKIAASQLVTPTHSIQSQNSQRPDLTNSSDELLKLLEADETSKPKKKKVPVTRAVELVEKIVDHAKLTAQETMMENGAPLDGFAFAKNGVVVGKVENGYIMQLSLSDCTILRGRGIDFSTLSCVLKPPIDNDVDFFGDYESDEEE